MQQKWSSVITFHMPIPPDNVIFLARLLCINDKDGRHPPESEPGGVCQHALSHDWNAEWPLRCPVDTGEVLPSASACLSAWL